MNSITERRVIHQVKIDPKINAPKIAASTSNTLGRSVSAEMLKAAFTPRLSTSSVESLANQRLHLARDEVSDWLDSQRWTLTALV
ncbi:hypothetical protein TNCV_4122431 [Trichonephila clavipes]|nr:hypothetical protein TNCV_4122431 [Trichonephila clavipes]